MAASKGRTKDQVVWRGVWDRGDAAPKERGSKRDWKRASESLPRPCLGAGLPHWVRAGERGEGRGHGERAQWEEAGWGRRELGGHDVRWDLQGRGLVWAALSLNPCSTLQGMEAKVYEDLGVEVAGSDLA